MVDLKNAVRVRMSPYREMLITPLRRGPRKIQTFPTQGLGFGNQAYLWLNAYRRQLGGEPYYVMAHTAMEAWFELFPTVRERLCLSQEELRFADQREAWKWALPDDFGADFTREELHAFVRDVMLSHIPLTASNPDSLVINVRRGNYYSVPAFRGRYSFDFQEYLRVALDRAVHDAGPIRRISVVSDDAGWCRTKLHNELQGWAADITYASAASPQEHFLELASARRIIGSNSTFSYWGGYVSSVLYGSASQVVVPIFHGRFPGSYEAQQIDPSWTVIQEIPGGWDG